MAEKHCSVTYVRVDVAYFEKRGLKRHAGVASLWALGVGAVISGHYSGWNFGLAHGFGPMFLATIIIGIMYLGLTFSIAEMSPALPHTGAAYSFARTAMGPWGGFVTGLAENIEYVLTPAVINFFIGAYLTSIFGTDPAFQPVYWIFGYVMFVGLNVAGVELSFKFTVVITLAALAVLLAFYVSAIPVFDFARWNLNIGAGPDGAAVELAEGGGGWFPLGVGATLWALPFAVWLFLAIEQLPLAAEESHDPKRDMPRGIILGILTLIVSAFCVLFLNSGVSPGAFGLSTSAEPLLDGFRAIYGGGLANVLALIAVIGLVASFHTIIFAYGRQIYSLSRAGYFPPALSVTHGTRKTPHVALVGGAVAGLAVMLIVWYSLGAEGAGSVIGATLLNMAVFGAMIAYIMQGIAYILLKTYHPSIPRPYKSPLGSIGAGLTVVIAAVTLVAQFTDASFRTAVVAVAIYYAVALAYFALVGRHKLILSPEEEFAVTKGEADYKTY